jgi:hypothetical protein
MAFRLPEVPGTGARYPQWPLTRADLARRYGVSVSTVTRALERAGEAHAADPAHPAPPQPVNPGDPVPRWWPEDFDPWWAARRRRGRPRKAPHVEFHAG